MLTEDFFGGRGKPGGLWTSLAQWRGDDRTLVALCPDADPIRATKVLAYGLEQLHGRALHIGVPAAAVPAMRHRAALLTADITTFEHADDGRIQQVPPSSQAESLRWFGSLGKVRAVKDVDSFDGPPWLLELIDWLESRRVERVRPKHSWAWHYRGRQVLQVKESGGRYKLVAGVAYSKPTQEQPAPVHIESSASRGLASQDLERVREAVDAAIERRRVGDDKGHREHLLQAALGVDPALIGLTRLLREYPAWRPGSDDVGGQGFIDFLGVDIDDGLHVVETKIGPDPTLGLQGLDYWAWVTSHKDAITKELGIHPQDPRPVTLDYVVACSDKALLHRAAAQTSDALHTDIPWRFHVITDWDTVARPGRLLRPRAVPGIRPGTVPDGTVCGEHADG